MIAETFVKIYQVAAIDKRPCAITREDASCEVARGDAA